MPFCRLAVVDAGLQESSTVALCASVTNHVVDICLRINCEPDVVTDRRVRRSWVLFVVMEHLTTKVPLYLPRKLISNKIREWLRDHFYAFQLCSAANPDSCTRVRMAFSTRTNHSIGFVAPFLEFGTELTSSSETRAFSVNNAEEIVRPPEFAGRFPKGTLDAQRDAQRVGTWLDWIRAHPLPRPKTRSVHGWRRGVVGSFFFFFFFTGWFATRCILITLSLRDLRGHTSRMSEIPDTTLGWALTA